MDPSESARNRLEHLQRALSHTADYVIDHHPDGSGRLVIQAAKSTSSGSDYGEVRIGDVTVAVSPTVNPEFVPDYDQPLFEDSQEVLRHLRWMMQKDKLRQDMFLIGPPGHLRRSIALKFAELTNREVEYVPLSKDVTESDLKQRREIVGGTAYYVDQACVRAATEGRILILDGIEKAERNVLPVLNNLLENREMALEDGRFLVHPARFDKLVAEGGLSVIETMERHKLVKVSEDFTVIALGLPVPQYVGHPLDPPLRSRFQSRDVKAPGFDAQMKHLASIGGSNVPTSLLERLVSVSMVLGAGHYQNMGESTGSATAAMGNVSIPEFPVSIESAVKLLSHFPETQPRFALDLVYPWTLLPTCEAEQRSLVEATYQRFGVLGLGREEEGFDEDEGKIIRQCESMYKLVGIERSGPHSAVATFEHGDSGKKVTVDMAAGPVPFESSEMFVETSYHMTTLVSMMMAHAVGDFCVIGTKGVGKSALMRQFGRNLGYKVEYIPLYKDMSSRDLLQRRSTTFAGDTVWDNSALVKAALSGALAIMDGIDTLSFGTMATLQRLIHERETALPDGRKLLRAAHYEALQAKHGWSEKQMVEKGLLKIHPAFRIVSLARPVSNGTEGGKPGAWLSPEIVSLFQFITVRPLSQDEETLLLTTLSPGVSEENLKLLLSFANRLRSDQDETIKSLSSAMSTRQLIRICRRLAVFPDECLYDAIHKVSLSRFLPSIAKQALNALLKTKGIHPKPKTYKTSELQIEVLPDRKAPRSIRIGKIEEPVRRDSNPVLVPNIVFHENPKQTEILMEMLKDFQLGEHLLLIGNQGVGKNKLADYFLQLLHLPREYIQLHRDTTVQSLTATPSIVDGVLQYEDSPLVKAVQEGYILVIDEADKAPTYVTSVIRNLLEDGQMVLSDGRRIVSRPTEGTTEEDEIVIHPDFRMMVLANRPGFPFLGNDFFREVGDVFSCHAVDNPDAESEMFLLRKYGPDVPEELLLKLTAAFEDLRVLVDEGMLSYPYSTRELVNVVRHMQIYPEEGISRILQNVFDFDQYDPDSKTMLIETFQKHGIPVGLDAEFAVSLGKQVQVSDPILTETWRKSPHEKAQPVPVKTQAIVFRGGWTVTPGTPRDLERSEGRSVVFSEQLYHFKIPTRGEALDILVDDGNSGNGMLYAITTNPVTLHFVDAAHRTVRSADMYEYFPLQRAPPRLKLAMVKTTSGGRFVCMHNPGDNSLLSLDTQKSSIVSIMLNGLSPLASTMDKSMAHLGYLAFSQENRSNIVLVDFNTGNQYTVELPVPIVAFYMLSPKVWVVRDSVKSDYYLVYARETDAPAPDHIQPVTISGLGNGKNKTRLTYITEAIPDADGSIRLMHTTNDGVVVSQAKNVESILAADPEAGFDVYSYMRPISDDNVRNMYSNLQSASIYLRKTEQMAKIIPSPNGRGEGSLELFSPSEKRIWRVTIPLSIPVTSTLREDAPITGFKGAQLDRVVASVCELPNGSLLTMDNAGFVRVWQVDAADLFQAASTWKKLVGTLDARTLAILYRDEQGQYVNAQGELVGADGQPILQLPESEEGDPLPDGMGGEAMSVISGGGGGGGGGGSGEGEGDGSGEGSGEGGGSGSGQRKTPPTEGRKPTFEDVSKLEIRTTAPPPQLISDAQMEMHNMTMRKHLESMSMTKADADLYMKYHENVQREIRELRVILESIEAKNKERVWLKNQSSGDLDDTKLIEGLTGEHNIYKLRGENDPEMGFQQKPKKMYFVFDLSASMYRFNTHDRRLERSMEVALMIMESFRSFEHKFAYQIVAHSGDSAALEFVKEGKYPRTEKDVFKILSQMSAHSQYCLSGDNTLAATATAMKEIVKEDADDYIVVVLSDANIGQYNIKPEDLARILQSDDRVTSSMIFIGSLADQADKLKAALGSHAHVCRDTKELPQIMKSIFLSSMLKA
ncbi:von Willebrand factor A domain-containing protein 8 [Actinomortierella ambigua]|uniref:von Willebrand factor A domain-containing protein 8 n=1 Tax=Actinomortierella ambigua TaxID=1343610 RepID=A0A9P6QGK3_9FUNG|nr:von Willebrand factor A domain-containing protein 8 [Actinomortierella ambigua]